MNTVLQLRSRRLRRTPLAACATSLFALAVPVAAIADPTNWPVTSCLDDGDGSLRQVIGAVTTLSGDTVDLSGLSCLETDSKISLTTGEILVPQASLTIKGPGAALLAIDGTLLPDGAAQHKSSRPFTHKGLGTLTIQDLTVTGGHVAPGDYYLALGGCIYSKNAVTLDHAAVVGCSASGAKSTVAGGGIYAKGTVTLTHSEVSGCSALGHDLAAQGGGIYSRGGLTMAYSTLSGNKASSTNGAPRLGGGARVLGSFSATYSTIKDNKMYGASPSGGGGLSLAGSASFFASTVSGNYSGGNSGGVQAFNNSPAALTFELTNSTVSGNTAVGNDGGLNLNSGTVKLYNSTIAFNQAAYAPGVELSSFFASIDARLQSTLMSNNSTGIIDGGDLRTSTPANSITFNGGDTATPANNLVRVTSVGNLPQDTKTSVCPLLGPLRNNGGLTETHALSSTSPAIDSGNTSAMPGTYDQRGSIGENGESDYLRTSKPVGDPEAAVADIGAFEVQQDEIVFDAGFEGCP